MLYKFSIIFFISINIGFSYCANAQESKSNELPTQYFYKAVELYDAGNYQAAQIAARNYLSLARTEAVKKTQAEFIDASSSLRIGESVGIERMEQFIRNQTGPGQASNAYFEIGNYWYIKQQYAKASTVYQKITWTYLDNRQQMQGRFQWGYALFTEKKLKEAKEQFNQVKRGNHEFVSPACYYAGFIALSEGNYEDAIVDLQLAEKNSSYQSIVPFLVATAYFKQNEYVKLIAYTTPLFAIDDLKNKREVGILTAESHFQLKEYAKAAELYLTYLDADKTKDESILYRAGLSFMYAKNFKDAITYLESAATADSEIAKLAAFQLGIAYLETGSKTQAQNAFAKARKSSNKAVGEQASFSFAKVCYDIGQADKAISELESFIVQYPQSTKNTEAKELLSQAYVNGNNYNKAIEYIESLPAKNLVIQQAYQKATYLKGVEWFNKDQFAQAEEMFKRSLSYPVNSKYVKRASCWLADLLSAQQKSDEAIEYYQKALTIKDDDLTLQAQASYGIGYVYFNQKKYNAAVKHFKELVDANDKTFFGFADGMLRLADCYYVEKRYDDALTYYSRFKLISSTDRDYASLQSGMILGIQGRYAEARTQFRSLVQDYPNTVYKAEGLYQWAQFELEQGNYQPAVDALSQLIEKENNSPFVAYALSRRATAYFNLKQYDNCAEDYQRVIKTYPNKPVAQEVLLPLQEVLTQLGKQEEFSKYLALVKQSASDTKGFEQLEFETAKKLYFDEKYDAAISALNNFKQSYADSKYTNEAHYYQAESQYRKKNWSEAVKLYEIIKSDKQFQFANRVAARIADCYFKQSNFVAAIPAYQYALQFAVNKRELFINYNGLMESHFNTSQYDSAAVYAQFILDRANVNVAAENKASLYLGKVALAKGLFDAAQDEFLNTLNSARDENGAEAKYLLATIFYLRKDFKQCNETLFSLNNDFSSYESWIGKSFLLLADSYLAQNEMFQAKATLQSLIDNFPSESIKQEARQKLQALEAKRNEVFSSDSITNDNQQ
jgi:tetratricopeptide (TPR) repeat protein